jgi:DNA-binding NtrC family response regulator
LQQFGSFRLGRRRSKVMGWQDGLEILARCVIGNAVSYENFMQACREAAIREALRLTKGHKVRAARLLGIHRNTLGNGHGMRKGKRVRKK